jgi:outer membrane protein assembly factor BamB
MDYEKVGRREFLQATGGAALLGSPFPVSSTVHDDYSELETWQQSGYISANTGYAANNTGPTDTVEQDWIFEDVGPAGITTDPAVADATVYVGGNSGFYALSTEDGTKRWSFGTRTSTPFGSPSVVNGTIFVTSDPNGDTGKLYALSSQEGTEQWTYELNTGETQPRVVAGTVYAGGTGGVYAISTDDGSETWHSPSSASTNFLHSELAVADGTVYIGDSSSKVGLYAFSVEDGSEQWFYETGEGVEKAPAIMDGTVYAIDDGGILHAVTTTEGTEQWRFDTASSGGSSASVVGETVLVIGKDLYALDSASGEIRWEYKIDDPGIQPTVAGDVAYVLDSGSTLHAVSISGGNRIWSFEITGKTYNAPAIADRKVYLGTTDGVVALTEAGMLANRPYIDADRVRDVDLGVGSVGLLDGAEGLLPAALGGLGVGGAGLWWLARGRNNTEQETPDNDEYLDEAVRPETSSVTDDEFDELLAEEFNEVHDTKSNESPDQTPEGLVHSLSVSLGYFSPSRVKQWWLTRQAKNQGTDHTADAGTTDSPKAISSAGTTGSGSESTGASEQRETIRSEALYSPDHIPAAPRVEVNYDKLTNREPIGEGGNADVMKATLATIKGEITLAVKRPRMHGTLHADNIERLLKEAETWSKLDSHDHIVGIVDYDSNPLPWIAMEHMDGGHLGERGGDMNIQQALWTSIAILNGLHHAHRRGVAHLDLKPENILFRTVQDAWDVPKIADWGLSKHLLEHPESVDGISPHYAAPEQFDDAYGVTDDITDIYQLGAVYYYLFTGKPPFDGEPTEAMYDILHTQPVPPSELTDVPNRLDEILLKALAKEKSDRYDSVVLFRNDLRNLLDQY